MLTIDGKPYEELNQDGSKLLQDLLKVTSFLFIIIFKLLYNKSSQAFLKSNINQANNRVTYLFV